MTKPKKEPEWGYREDGKPRTFGDLSPDEQRDVANRAAVKLQAEADDPNSTFRRTLDAILTGPVVPPTKH